MIPTYEADLFTDDALDDPYGHLRTLRDLGPVVWLEARQVYAVTRYEVVRAVLADGRAFCSGEGVGLNEFINEGGRGTTLMSDGVEHDRLRTVIGRPLTPKALAELRQEAHARAAALADRVVARREVDAVTDVAEVLPTTWVPDLLGWPQAGREHLLDWAGATFDGLGPLNDRALAAGAGIHEMADFAQKVAASDLPDGSTGAGILAAAERGEIDAGQCPMMFIGYLGPSLDTTTAALANAIWLFATHPEQWDVLRRQRDRVKQAFNEVLRLESPISCFTRVATRTVDIAGVTVPAGARVLVSFASANRDEHRWDGPEEFDITRTSAGHVGFGHGEHACVGMGLARLEATAVLSALAARVERFELCAPTVRKHNNLIRSFASLPVTVVAD